MHLPLLVLGRRAPGSRGFPVLVLVTAFASLGLLPPAARGSTAAPGHQEMGLPGASPQPWAIALEIAFGAGSLPAHKFPDLYALPYATNEAITRQVLGHLLPLAARETRVRPRGLVVGPGGYLDNPVVPAARWEVDATPAQLATALETLGYLAGQTQVLAFSPAPQGKVQSLTLIPAHRTSLHDPQNVRPVWHQLRGVCPFLTGFAPCFAGQPPRQALEILDTAGTWGQEQRAQLQSAATQMPGHYTLRWSKAQLQAAGNDWTRRPSGQNYLANLRRSKNSGLARRLPGLYRTKMERWLQEAFRRHAPTAGGAIRLQPLSSPSLPARSALFRTKSLPQSLHPHGSTHSH